MQKEKIGMHKETSHKVPVKDYDFSKELTVDELVLQMDSAWGFTAGKLATGVNIMEAMINDKECVKFLSFTADIVATGTRGVIRELVKHKLIDVIITTCGTLRPRCSTLLQRLLQRQLRHE